MSGSIVALKAGQVIPSVLHDLLEKKHSTCLNICSADEEGVQWYHLSDKHDWTANIPKIMEAFGKQLPVSMHYGQYENLVEEDLQPYPLIQMGNGDDAIVLLAAMLEGEFPGFAKGEGHINEYHVVREILADTFKELYQESGEKLEEMLKLADQAKFRRTLKGVLSPRGAVLIIPAVGPHMMFSEGVFNEGSTGATFPWGICTRTHNYSEVGGTSIVTKEKTVTEPVKEMTKAERLKAELAGRDKPTETTPVQVSVVPKISQEKTIKCPPTLQGKARDKWIHRNIAQKFQFKNGWQGDVEYPVNELKSDAPAMGQFKTFEEAAAALEKRQTPDTPVKVEEKPAVTTEFQTVFGPKTKEHLKALLDAGRFGSDPAAQIQRLEEPFDTFTAQMGIDENIPLFWSPEGFHALVQQNVYGASVLLYEFCQRIHKLQPQIATQMMEKLTAPEQKETIVKEMTKAEKLQALLTNRKTVA